MSIDGGPGASTAPPEERYFFLHLQKTAGTAVWRLLTNAFPAESLYPAETDGSPPLTTLSVDHLLERWRVRGASIRIVAGHFPLCTTELLGGDFRTFTLLRDPVERTLSFLRHHRELSPEDAHRSLEELYDDPIRRALVVNHMTRMLSLTADEMTDGAMTEMDVDEPRLRSAVERLAGIDVVGVQERFEPFCRSLDRTFGWDLGPPVFMNRTTHVAVDPALRRRIADENGPDIALYEEARRLAQ